MHGATIGNQKVFLSSAKEEEEGTTRLASEMMFKVSPDFTTTMPLNANRNNVHNSIVQVPSTLNDAITCNTTTTTTSSTSSTSMSSNVSARECEVESQLVLKVSPTHVLAPVPPNNHDTLGPAAQQTAATTDNISDKLQSTSGHELKSTDATCSIKTTAVENDESAVSSSATHVPDSSCSNEPILSLIVTSEHAKETAEGTIRLLIYMYTSFCGQ